MNNYMQTPLRLNGINENFYAGFWLRLGAQILDTIFVLPVLFLLLYLNGLDKYMYFYTLLPSLMFILWYNVYLPQKRWDSWKGYCGFNYNPHRWKLYWMERSWITLYNSFYIKCF